MALYGKTWWGQKWLEAFTGIDQSNRLPRGRTYANTGRAYDILIKGNNVEAKVQGSRPKPYKVKITFEDFDQVKQEQIREIISRSPLILSTLLNKKLPSELLQKLNQAAIKLFPSQWREIEASCSCPDWAIPCKHIAAVIYLICSQIDKNPFVLFEVHNCDLLSLIADYKEGRVATLQKIPTVEDLFQRQHQSSSEKSTFDQTVLSEIDLSPIPDLLSCILTILADNPPFFDKNFREILGSAYKYWQSRPLLDKKSAFLSTTSKKTKEELSPEEIFLAQWDHPEKYNNFDLVVKNDQSLASVCDGDRTIFSQAPSSEFALITFLNEIPSSLLHKLCPKIRFMHMVYLYALKLLEKSAIIPQILQNKDKCTFIRWVPALFDPQVRSIYDELCSICPDELVKYGKVPLSPKEQVKVAISLMISALIHSNLPSPLMKLQQTDVCKLFFFGERLFFESFNDKEVPDSINQWLKDLYVSEKKHKLYLKIEEKKGGFSLSPQVLLGDALTPISIKKALQTKDFELKLSILSDLSLISHYLPDFDTLISEDSDALCTLDSFAPLFLTIVPALRAIGVVIILPKSLHKILKPRINLKLNSKEQVSDNRKSLLSLEHILDFNWQIAIGTTTLSIEEFKKILKASRSLVKIMDQYVLLDEKEMEALLKQLDKLPNHLTQEELMRAMLAEELNGATVELDSNLKKLLDTLNTYEQVKVPDNLNAKLRPYQERGFNWLIQNIKTGFGSILADDMGLGKTVQVISSLLYFKNNGFIKKENPSIIVAPTSLLSNWQKEIEKFAPDLKAHIYHGNKRELAGEYDVLITSYGLVRSDKKELNKQKWFLLVVDEAQTIKNPFSEQTKAVKSLEAVHKIAMSGTPVENRLLDYWSIFDFTNKAYLGTLKQFKDYYASPIEKERDKGCLSRFKKITSPFILRRVKSDKTIIADLPDKIENNRYCLLTKQQIALYQNVVDTTIKKIEKSQGIERKGMVLQLINSLKQVCNHPSQFKKKQEQEKVSIDQSGKMLMLEEILAEIDSLGEKCLIFTQYVEMGEILVQLIENKMGLQVPFLHGGSSRKARDQMVHDFQTCSNKRIFIISLKAGGTGLNLTAANHVIHYDLWWNPAVENQATDRAYRIGQNRNVIVHRLITNGTFEERINEIIKSKKEIADIAVSDGENWITEMTTAQIKDLVSLQHYD